jgi:hypothetical protein
LLKQLKYIKFIFVKVITKNSNYYHLDLQIFHLLILYKLLLKLFS